LSFPLGGKLGFAGWRLGFDFPPEVEIEDLLRSTAFQAVKPLPQTTGMQPLLRG
jgi:hypothetical protein